MQKTAKYTTSQIITHWLSAVIVLLVIMLSLLKEQLADSLGGRGNLFMIHKSLGVIVFFITLWRVYIIIKQGIPEVLPEHAKLQRIVSKSVQGMMYILLLVLPLSGYFMSARPISFFNWFDIGVMMLSSEVRSIFHSIHLMAAMLIIVLILLHIIAALYHRFWLKDQVMQSMLMNK